MYTLEIVPSNPIEPSYSNILHYGLLLEFSICSFWTTTDLGSEKCRKQVPRRRKDCCGLLLPVPLAWHAVCLTQDFSSRPGSLPVSPLLFLPLGRNTLEEAAHRDSSFLVLLTEETCCSQMLPRDLSGSRLKETPSMCLPFRD